MPKSNNKLFLTQAITSLCLFIVIYCLFYKNFFGNCPSITKKSNTRYGQVEADFSHDNKIRELIKEIEDSRPPYTKVVNFMIDALWFRYIDPKAESSICTHRLDSAENHLEEYPLSTDLLKFIGDPPTTTRERTKSEFTGSISKYRDIAFSFKGYEITEDNTYYQLKVENKRIIRLGSEFPLSLLNSSYMYYSNITEGNILRIDMPTDLVDENIIPWLQGANGDWDLILSHIGAVDNVGHAYKSSCSSDLGDQLSRANYILRNTINSLPQGTIIFVYGDHGLTPMGGHTGASQSELTSALFIATRAQNLLFKVLNHIEDYILHPIQKYIILNIRGKMNATSLPFGETRDSVTQMSLAATIAYIMRTPIPFNNLGYILPEAVPYNVDKTISQQVFDLAFEYLINIAQIQRFLSEASRLYAPQYLQEYNLKYAKLRDMFKSLLELRENAIKQEHLLMADSDDYQNKNTNKIEEFILGSIQLIKDSQNLLDLNIKESQIAWLTLQTKLVDYSLILFLFYFIFMIIWISSIYLFEKNICPYPNTIAMGKLCILFVMISLFLLYYNLRQNFDYLLFLLILLILVYNILVLLYKCHIPNWRVIYETYIKSSAFIIGTFFSFMSFFSVSAVSYIKTGIIADHLLIFGLFFLGLLILKHNKSAKLIFVIVCMIAIGKFNSLFSASDTDNSLWLNGYELPVFASNYLPTVILLFLCVFVLKYSTLFRENIKKTMMNIYFIIFIFQAIGVMIYFIGEDKKWTKDYYLIKYIIPQFIYHSSIFLFGLPWFSLLFYSFTQKHLFWKAESTSTLIQTKCFSILLALSMTCTIILLTGKNYILTYLTGFIFIYLLRYLATFCDEFVFCLQLIYCGFILNMFFATGHIMRFDALHFIRGFIGFQHINYTIQGILIVIEAFGPIILLLLLVPFIFLNSSATEKPQYQALPVPGTKTRNDELILGRYGISLAVIVSLQNYSMLVTLSTYQMHTSNCFPKTIFSTIITLFAYLLAIVNALYS